MALWPSGLGNYFVCRRFPVQTLLWSLEFVIQINLEHDTIASLKLGSKLKYLNIMDFLFFRKVRDTSLTCKIVVFPSYLFFIFFKVAKKNSTTLEHRSSTSKDFYNYKSSAFLFYILYISNLQIDEANPSFL